MIRTRIKKVEGDKRYNVKYYVQTRGLPRNFFSHNFKWWFFIIPFLNILAIIMLLAMISEHIFWKDECKKHGTFETNIGVFNSIYDAQEYCDILLAEDIAPVKEKKPKKKITYIKYP
jgi:hypothetical protein